MLLRVKRLLRGLFLNKFIRNGFTKPRQLDRNVSMYA